MNARSRIFHPDERADIGVPRHLVEPTTCWHCMGLHIGSESVIALLSHVLLFLVQYFILILQID